MNEFKKNQNKQKPPGVKVFVRKNNNYILVNVNLCAHYVPGSFHPLVLQDACEAVIILTPISKMWKVIEKGWTCPLVTGRAGILTRCL